ncbi:MAG: ABC transporter ATP-binding protein [Clostridium sp.]|nr:ABC transporter ATP-binding protein [Clostridium sp.]
MIQVEHVTKKFGKEFTAVNDLNFTINKGEIVGFVGQNGAGKTTTIKMLTGILKPTEGKVSIHGYDMQKEALKAKESLAYVADNPDMFLRLSGMEFIQLMADIYQVPEADRQPRIQTLAERFEVQDVLGQPMSDYSHGMRQKMMVCAALIHNPPVWILDEPMTGLDPKAAYELKNMMREHAAEGNCVFFSTHVLEVAEQLCDRIIIIRNGEVVFNGTLDELRQAYPGKSLEMIFLEINGEAEEATE